MLIKNKKGVDDLLFMTLAFLFFVTVFGLSVLYFASHSKNAAVLQEEIYAKKIALIIDSARPGTKVILDVSELVDIKEKNKYASTSPIIHIDNDGHWIQVNLGVKGGITYSYFNDVHVVWGVEGNKLTMDIKKK